MTVTVSEIKKAIGFVVDEAPQRGRIQGVYPKIVVWDADGELSIRSLHSGTSLTVAREDARAFAEALLQMVKDAGL